VRHEKEWYTCDRCGSGFDRLPEDRNWFSRRLMSPAELEMIYEESTGFVSDKYRIKKDTLSVEIRECFSRRNKTLHLCPKCRKDFERFMDNE
jgi:hypothetical protein